MKRQNATRFSVLLKASVRKSAGLKMALKFTRSAHYIVFKVVNPAPVLGWSSLCAGARDSPQSKIGSGELRQHLQGLDRRGRAGSFDGVLSVVRRWF